MPLDFVAPFCPSRVLMRSNHGAIDRVFFPIDLSRGIALLLQRLQNFLPNAGFDPAIEAACHRSPGAIVVGQISPRRSRPHDPEDPIEDEAMIVGWTPSLWLLRRQ